MDSFENLEFINDEKLGRGLWWQGHFIYWNQALGRPEIAVRSLRRKADRLINLIAYFIAVFGWLALAYWLFSNRNGASIDTLMFWQHRHPLILAFLISFWADLFLYYRRSEAKASRDKIKYHLLKEDKSGKTGESYNAATGISDELLSILEKSFILASKLKQEELLARHFFRNLLSSPSVQNVFVRLNVSAKDLLSKLERHLVGPEGKGQPKLSLEVQEVLLAAFLDAAQRGQEAVEPLNALMFCYRQDKVLAEVLYDLAVDADKISNACEWMQINRRLMHHYQKYRRLASLKPGNGMDRAYTAVATPTLDHFSHDLTLAAKYGRLELCVGRDEEISSIFEIMSSGQAGVLLVGPSGTGKTEIIGGVAQLMVEEKVPAFLKDKRLVEIDVSRLVSGASPAEAEERLLASISEASRSGNIILHIANIENLVGISAGKEESLDLSEVLAEALKRGQVYCLATVTNDNYARFLEKTALGESMTTVGVKEPSINKAIQILESKVAWLEGKYRVFITYNAVEKAVKLSNRYLHDKFLPAKAINLLQSAAIEAAKDCRRNPEHCICDEEYVAKAISDLTGVPAQKLSENESEKLLSLEKNIHKRMIGQEEAVKAVSASLRRARAEMKDIRRPIASFLFLGPTGVGKTELAKTVSEVYFGSESYMVRLDMSEYQAADSVRKMIGDVDGSLGYLTEAVRKKPFTLILLDEIEKAHPDILNLFLQLLDDGRLTDGQGRTISFSESIIIATSNIGALYIQDEMKKGTEVAVIKQGLIDEQLNKFMRPELVNRFDGIIVFKPLSEDSIFKIATLMLKQIKQRLDKKGVNLKADREGVVKLAKQGYDPKFGARPLRRLLQDKVEDEIANKLLSGELQRRDTIVIGADTSISVVKGKDL